MIYIDKYDRIIACSSGALTAALDVFWVKDISLIGAHEWGVIETNKFVVKVAQNKGFTGEKDDVAGAIDFLEELAPIWADKTTNSFGGGKQHHLRDFSHHPTPIGLMFSLINEFSGYGIGTDTSGKLIKVPIEGWNRKGFLESIYSGTVTWTLHMISDIAGSSGSVRMGKEGTGIPGPLMSMLKELSSVPGIRSIAGKDADGKYRFSKTCSKLFNGTLLGAHDENGHIIKGEELKFDMRTELGIVHESIDNKQYIPILLCEGIVCAFYSIRRLLEEIKRKEISSITDLEKLDFSSFLPWKSDSLKRMRTISALTFSSIDLSVAAIKAYSHNKDNKSGFAVEFLSGINYFGMGRLFIAGTGELGIKVDSLYQKYQPISEEVKRKIDSIIDPELKEVSMKFVTTATTIAGIGTPIGFISAAIGVYKEISEAVDEYNIAKEERLRIESECSEAIMILNEYQVEMEAVVSEYMIDRLTVFGAALNQMDAALLQDDTDSFIQGNNQIQNKLGKESQFSSMDEFDALMSSDGDFKL